MDQTPQSSSDLQGGKIVWNLDIDDSSFAAKLQSDSKAADDFSKNLDKNMATASGSFDKLSGSANSVLTGLKETITNGGAGLQGLQETLLQVGSGSVAGISPKIQDLANNLAIARQRQGELANSNSTTESSWMRNKVAIQGYKDKLVEAIDSEASASKSSAQMGQSFGSMVASITTGTLAAIGITDALNGVKSAITSDVQSAASLEQTRVAFETMLGSADAAQTMLQKLSDFAVKTPFILPTLQDGVRQLMAYGVSANDVLPTIKALGDIAAGVGTDKLPQLTHALGQVAASGKLTGIQLREFSMAGVPMMEELTKVTGKSTAQIQQDMRAGSISYGQVQAAIADMTSQGGRFFDMMQKQSTTFNGVTTNIVDQAGRIGRAIIGISEGGDIQKGGIFDTLKNGLTDFMNFLTNNAGAITTTLQLIFSTIQVAFTPVDLILQFLAQHIAIIAPALGGLLLAFGAVQGIQLFITGINMAIDAVKAFQVASLIATLTNPWLLLGAVIATVFGYVLYDTFNRLQSVMSSATQSAKSVNDTIGQLPAAADAAAGGLDKIGQKVEKIDDQIAKQQRNFQESLAQAVKAHQDKAAQLQKDLNNENDAYADSVAKKKAALDLQDANEAKAHETHLIDLQRQLDQELATNHNANSLKAQDLQAAIAKENADYAQKTATNLATYQADVQNAKETHDQKINDLTTQLKAETDLLQKHADDVASVKNVMLLDDIDKLKQSNADQLASLNEQKQQTLASVASTNSGVMQQYNNLAAQLKNNPGFTDTGKQMGNQMGKAFVDALTSALWDTIRAPGGAINSFLGGIDDALRKGTSLDAITKALQQIPVPNLNFVPHLSSGGRVSAGQGVLVGDNPDGSLNSTSELFVPDVAGTVVPNSGLKGIGSRANRPINVTYNVYNTTDQTRFLRDMAWQIGNT